MNVETVDVEHADVLGIGDGMRDLSGLAGGVGDGNQNGSSTSWRIDIGLDADIAVFDICLVHQNGWCRRIVVIVAARGETKGKDTRESQHEAHIFQIFHCYFQFIICYLLFV